MPDSISSDRNPTHSSTKHSPSASSMDRYQSLTRNALAGNLPSEADALSSHAQLVADLLVVIDDLADLMDILRAWRVVDTEQRLNHQSLENSDAEVLPGGTLFGRNLGHSGSALFGQPGDELYIQAGQSA